MLISGIGREKGDIMPKAAEDLWVQYKSCRDPPDCQSFRETELRSESSSSKRLDHQEHTSVKMGFVCRGD